VKNPSRQPTPFYTVFCPHFHSLAASLHHFTTVKDSEKSLLPAYTILQLWRIVKNPSRQPTPFLQHWKDSEKPLLPAYTIFTRSIARFVPLLPAYDILCRWRTVKTLAASLGRFTRFFAPFHSLAASLHRFYNSEKPLPPAYTILTTVKDPCRQPTPFYTVYCPIIYLDLSIRLKKVHGFLSFSHWKLRVFLRFSHIQCAVRTFQWRDHSVEL
jgi:hypothetical protein